MYGDPVPFNTLLGKTLKAVARDGDDEIKFITTEGQTFRMMHHQDCCEDVTIESVVGNLIDLVGNPILLAEEARSEGTTESDEGPGTWTFYKLATIKGYVDIRWFGASSYYSEDVDFELITH